MAGRFFDIVPKDVARDFIAKNPNGGRFRTPPMVSKHNPLYLEERNRAICQDAQTGETREAVARKYKLTVRTVIRILKENNIETRKENAESLEERIRLALRLKTPVSEIAKWEGRSRQWIYQVIKEKNLR